MVIRGLRSHATPSAWWKGKGKLPMIQLAYQFFQRKTWYILPSEQSAQVNFENCKREMRLLRRRGKQGQTCTSRKRHVGNGQKKKHHHRPTAAEATNHRYAGFSNEDIVEDLTCGIRGSWLHMNWSWTLEVSIMVPLTENGQGRKTHDRIHNTTYQKVHHHPGQGKKANTRHWSVILGFRLSAELMQNSGMHAGTVAGEWNGKSDWSDEILNKCGHQIVS